MSDLILILTHAFFFTFLERLSTILFPLQSDEIIPLLRTQVHNTRVVGVERRTMHDDILEDVKLFLLVWRQRWIVLLVLCVESQELTLLFGCQVDHSRMSSIDWNAIFKQVKEFVQFFILRPSHVLLVISFSTELLQHTKLIRR